MRFVTTHGLEVVASGRHSGCGTTTAADGMSADKKHRYLVWGHSNTYTAVSAEHTASQGMNHAFEIAHHRDGARSHLSLHTRHHSSRTGQFKAAGGVLRRSMNRFFLAALTSHSAATVLRPLTKGVASIFTLHRFADSRIGIDSHAPQALRANLALLRQRGYRFCSLDELLSALEAGQAPPARSIVFTVDDGYEDALRLGAPVFAEFDCPVHIALTTGFVDRTLWMWWDKIEYVIDRTTRQTVDLDLGDELLKLHWFSASERRAVAVTISESLKRVADAQKLELIAWLSHTLEVELPLEAPPEYAPLSWNSIRWWAQRGVTFGPHTVTHPILSRCDETQAWTELAQSWQRVRDEVPEAQPVFCYPNGYVDDFSSRDCTMLRALGLRAGLTMDERHVDRWTLARTSEARYRVPRFAYSDDRQSLLRVVNGVERAASVIRSRIAVGAVNGC